MLVLEATLENFTTYGVAPKEEDLSRTDKVRVAVRDGVDAGMVFSWWMVLVVQRLRR